MGKIRVFSVIITSIVTLVVILASWSCSQRGYQGPVESITIGTVLLEPSAPIIIAQQERFFTQNGLNVTMKYYDTGLSAVNGMLTGEVDVSAPVAEYVLVGKAFNKDRVQVIASVDQVDYAFIIGRKDRGIRTISDLKGKKIGVPRGTVLEFYLGRFLELHGMSMEEVIPVNVMLSQSADAIIKGDVDAVASFQPYTTAAQNELGDNVVLWPAQCSQAMYALVICRDNWITDHPELVTRLLKSLSLAEGYIIQHPEEAKALTQLSLSFSDAYMDAVWPKQQYSLYLDQSLITAMEDEARWMISDNLTLETQVPDFNEYIYEDCLKAIKPDAVDIIR